MNVKNFILTALAVSSFSCRTTERLSKTELLTTQTTKPPAVKECSQGDLFIMSLRGSNLPGESGVKEAFAKDPAISGNFTLASVSNTETVRLELCVSWITGETELSGVTIKLPEMTTYTYIPEKDATYANVDAILYALGEDFSLQAPLPDGTFFDLRSVSATPSPVMVASITSTNKENLSLGATVYAGTVDEYDPFLVANPSAPIKCSSFGPSMPALTSSNNIDSYAVDFTFCPLFGTSGTTGYEIKRVTINGTVINENAIFSVNSKDKFDENAEKLAATENFFAYRTGHHNVCDAFYAKIADTTITMVIGGGGVRAPGDTSCNGFFPEEYKGEVEKNLSYWRIKKPGESVIKVNREGICRTLLSCQ